jgi:hypothetical protein
MHFGNEPMSSSAANDATVALAAIAVIAAFITAWAAINARNSQREATAKDIYRDYLKLAFQHPKFANPEAFGDLAAMSKNEEYRWFVAFMLNSCDEIARIKSRDKGWRKTIRLDLRMHEEYLESPEFVEDGGWGLYSRELKCIAKEALD